MDSRFAEVATALADYFDGLHFSDTARLRRIFHPKAHYVSAADTPLRHLTMDEYLPIVDARPSPASRGEPRQDRILSIEFAGPAAAFVRAECRIAPKSFIDLLTLVHADGRWQIISKVFHTDIVE